MKPGTQGTLHRISRIFMFYIIVHRIQWDKMDNITEVDWKIVVNK